MGRHEPREPPSSNATRPATPGLGTLTVPKNWGLQNPKAIVQGIIRDDWGSLSLRVQVPNNHILAQNLYYNCYYPEPKYLIIGYMDPLGFRDDIGSTLTNALIYRLRSTSVTFESV